MPMKHTKHPIRGTTYSRRGGKDNHENLDFYKGGPYENAGDPNNYDVHVILYYWHSCPPCKAFLPVWKDEFLPLINKNPNVRIYASTYERSNIPEGIEVSSFPTIMILYGKKSEKYEGPRTAKDLYSHLLEIIEKISVKVLENGEMPEGKKEEKKKEDDEQCGGKKRKVKNDNYYKYKYYKYKTLYLEKKKALSRK